MDVVVERFERGDVKNADAIFEITLVSPLFICRLYIFFHQMIDTPEKRGECFSGTGWRDDKRTFPCRDRRPSEPLGRAWFAERFCEP